MSELHALFGGTFDPIHYGHLRPVEALAQQVELKRVTLLPNNVPPHRPQPEASAAQRVDMLRCAIKQQPLFEIDTRELQRDTPSWTVTTLEALRAERGNQQPLGFIIGQDSLLTVAKWHRWQALLSLCHLLVCKRPGYAANMDSPEMQRWLEQHLTHDVRQLHQRSAGCIWLAETPLYDISATEIRQRRHQNQPCDDLLPAAVIAYIDHAGLYRD
ncbi:MAG: nicotinate-nucleotide adenylyltransferase [Enterobacterales bacterium endosymbiont of Blomia tropicalis]|uniref:nicotinate-nucleotide adenylyltransferase n=1 Tax=Mixta mediterraneensis TaxID=2758443 RepID=UPI001873F5C5|nr:nicotinate-nucleotide adenylyltransferase [Mixta mediterraneensis]MBE5252556.1 nicotinate-nucleotide adenylyltransferase [Mixta mediterraneensis]MDL4913616.1 nicotinate-nucleotide adenylyltransferase [Mixta mediterraneensis]